MELIDFYRLQFLHALNEFEAGWKELIPYPLGYRWDKQSRGFHEIFRITREGERAPLFIYSLVLPEKYKEQNLLELIEPFQSQYEITLTYSKSSVIINICLDTELFAETVLGFLFRARGELVDLIEISVFKTGDRSSMHADAGRI